MRYFIHYRKYQNKSQIIDCIMQCWDVSSLTMKRRLARRSYRDLNSIIHSIIKKDENSLNFNEDAMYQIRGIQGLMGLDHASEAI